MPSWFIYYNSIYLKESLVFFPPPAPKKLCNEKIILFFQSGLCCGVEHLRKVLFWSVFNNFSSVYLLPDLFPCRFPLFTAVYEICYKNKPVSEFITCLQDHPEHL